MVEEAKDGVLHSWEPRQKIFPQRPFQQKRSFEGQQQLPQGLGHPLVAPMVPRQAAAAELARLDAGIRMNWK